MKKCPPPYPQRTFLQFFALLLLLLSTAHIFAQNTRRYHRQIVKTEKKIAKAFRKTSHNSQETPLGYWQQEYIATMDPNLLRPTPEVLLPHLHKPITKRTAPGLPETPWISRGPNNVGGRTRALCFDPNDNTGKKVWAGAVTGGLWYNNDISNADSLWRSVSTLWPNLTVTCIAFDPNDAQTIYVGTGEGFGSTFSSSRGYGIFKSTNGGQTWTHLSSTADYYYINDITVRNENGSSVLYAATDILFYGGQWNGSPSNIGLMRSTDGGTSFTNVMPALSGSVYTYAVADIEIDAQNRIWCGTRRNYALSGTDLGGGRILYSDDGQNFTLAYTRSTALQGRVELACAPSNKDTLYAVFEANNQCEAVMRSFDRGANWTSFTEPNDADLGIPSTDFTRGQAWYDLILAVNPKKASEVLIGGIDLFRSTEAGNNWAQISRWSVRNANLNQLTCSYVHADQHQIAIHPDGKRVLFGTDGGVFYAPDIQNTPQTNGTAIVERNNHYLVTQFYGGSQSNAAGSHFMLAGAQDNGTLYFTQAGLNDEQLLLGGDGGLNFISKSDGNKNVVSYIYNNFYGTTDFWNTFTQLLSDNTTGKFINAAVLDDNNDVLFTGKAAGTLYRNALGNTGSQAATISFGSSALGRASFLQALKKKSDGKTRLYVGTDAGALLYADDPHTGTPTFTAINTGINNGNISSIYAHNQNPDTLFITLSNYGITNIYYSLNGGSSWNAADGNLGNMPVHSIVSNPYHPGEVLIGTELGVYGCDNIFKAQPVWKALNENMGAVKVSGLYLRETDGTIMCTTHGRGVYTSDIWRTDSVALIQNKIYSNSQIHYQKVALFNGATLRLDSSVTIHQLYLRNGIIDLNGHRLTITGGIFSSTDSANYNLQAGTTGAPKPLSELVFSPLANVSTSVYFKPNTNTIRILELGNDSANAHVSLGNSLILKGGATPSTTGFVKIHSGSHLNINNGAQLNLACDTFNAYTLLSDAATAALSCTGTGKLNIEREHYGARGWRLYAHPFNQAIDVSGLADDIDLIGPGGTSEGFASDVHRNASAYWYDYAKADSTQGTDPAWTPFTSAKGSNLAGNPNDWNAQSPILVFNPGAEKGSGAFSNPSAANYQKGRITLSYGVGTGFNLNDGSTQSLPATALANAVKSGYYFLCNPYTAPIKLAHIGGLNSSNCEPYFYYWKQRHGALSNNFMPAQWQSELLTTGNTYRDTNVAIPAFGCILVQLKNTTTNFSVAENAKQIKNFDFVIGNDFSGSGLGVEQSLFSRLEQPRQGPGGMEIELLINDSVSVDRLLVYDREGATANYESADALKFRDASFANIYSVSGDGKFLSLDQRDIGNLLNSGMAEVEIPLVIARDFSKVQGGLRIRMGEKHSEWEVYFKDAKTGKLTLAESDSDIAVEISGSETHIHRYSLVVKRSNASTEDITQKPPTAGRTKVEVFVNPNPVEDQLQLKVIHNNGELPFYIYLITGVMVMEGSITSEKIIQTAGLDAGVYVIDAGGVKVKFVKK